MREQWWIISLQIKKSLFTVNENESEHIALNICVIYLFILL